MIIRKYYGGEVLIEKEILQGPGANYQRLVEEDWHKYNKDKIKIDPNNKAYIEGVSPGYGAPGLYLHKNYAYGARTIDAPNYPYNTVYIVYQIDLDTFEAIELFHNRQR